MSNNNGKKVYLSSEDFLAGITVTPEDFDVPGLGLVSVRGLTALEVGQLNKEHKGDDTRTTLGLLMIGMVYPALPSDAMARLENGSFGKMMPVIKRIQALSGMTTNEAESENLESPPGDGS